MMTLLQRLRRLVRAYFSGTPADMEQALETMLAEVETQLAEARAELAVCRQEEQRVATQVAEAHQEAARMRQAAARAVQGGQPELAREALRRHLAAQAQADRLQQLRDVQRQQTRRLQAMLQAVEARQQEMALRRQGLQASRQMARARRALLRSLRGVDDPRLALLEEQLRGEVHQAEAYATLVNDPLASRIDALDAPPHDEAVEHALARLQAELALPPPADDHTAPREGI